jgi:CRP/FNR family transcriptional regulator
MAKFRCDVRDCVFHGDGSGAVTDGVRSSRTSCVLGAIAHRVHFRDQDYLVREGYARTHFHVVRSGYVKLTSILASGRTQITGLRGSGQLVGFAWERTVYPYTATALTPITACRIAHRAVLQVLQQESAVTLRVLERLAEELAQARTLIRDIGGRNARQRIASFILSLCPQEIKAASTLPLPLRRQEMAELLGLSRETVSRVISDLMADGLILIARGRVSILSPAGLSACASGTRGDARATLM